MSYAASESTSGPVTFGVTEKSFMPILLVAGIAAALLVLWLVKRK